MNYIIWRPDVVAVRGLNRVRDFAERNRPGKIIQASHNAQLWGLVTAIAISSLGPEIRGFPMQGAVGSGTLSLSLSSVNREGQETVHLGLPLLLTKVGRGKTKRRGEMNYSPPFRSEFRSNFMWLFSKLFIYVLRIFGKEI